MALSQFLSAQRMQNEAIKAFGHVVKNTFIDDAAAPAAPSAARQRASSLPAASRFAGDEACCDVAAGESSWPLSAAAHVAPRRGRSGCGEEEVLCTSRCRDLSIASTTSTRTSIDTATTCSTATPCSSFSWAEASAMEEAAASPAGAEAEDPAAKLAALVERECAFLRLTDKVFYEETTPVRKQRGVVKCAVFYCRGLPWAKRSKWLLPLLWSVAAVLKTRGCNARVQSGELYAQLPGSDETNGNLIRLDFAAARV
jgi:hypothetical protein